MIRHRKTHEENIPSFKCEICEMEFSRSDNFKRHLTIHENPQYTCKDCNQKFSTKFNFMQHVRTQHGSTSKFVSVKKPRLQSNNNIKNRNKKMRLMFSEHFT